MCHRDYCIVSWRVWRAPDVFFGFGLAIYYHIFYIYDIGVWTPPAPAPRNNGTAAEFSQLSFQFPCKELRASDCFRLVFAHSAARPQPTVPPYPPLVSALRLVCCLRVQIWLSLSTCCACSHRAFTLGPPCMGLLGPCRLKSFFCSID